MPPENIVIAGSSGHAKVVIDIVEREGRYRIAGLLDRHHPRGEKLLGYQVLGADEELPSLVDTYNLKGVVVAIGDNLVRSEVIARVEGLCPNLPFVCATHPRATIARDVSVGDGTVVMAGVTINSSCRIGLACILNTNSSLDHDSIMEDFSSLAPGAVTGGNCRVGFGSAIGIGATLVHNVDVGEHTVVGAGSLVLDPVPSFKLVYGVPAKIIRSRARDERYL